MFKSGDGNEEESSSSASGGAQGSQRQQQGGQASTGNKRTPKRIIDETLLAPEEARKLELRRSYNRKCAANARKRTKEMLSSLQEQVDQLSKEKAELKHENDLMKAKLEVLTAQNQTLMMNQLNQLGPGSSQQAGTSGVQAAMLPSGDNHHVSAAGVGEAAHLGGTASNLLSAAMQPQSQGSTQQQATLQQNSILEQLAAFSGFTGSQLSSLQNPHGLPQPLPQAPSATSQQGGGLHHKQHYFHQKKDRDDNQGGFDHQGGF